MLVELIIMFIILNMHEVRTHGSVIPHMESNMAEWNKIQGMSKDNLLQYYSEQEYLKKYACV